MLRSAGWVYKTLLYGTQPKHFQIAQITRFRPENASKKYIDQRLRMPCPVAPPPPPPDPSQATSKETWIWGSLAVLVTAGIFVGFAHTSKEIRDWLTLYAPWMDDVISIIYQEDMSYLQFVGCCVKEIKRYIRSEPNLEKSCDREKDPMPDFHQEPKPEPNLTREVKSSIHK